MLVLEDLSTGYWPPPWRLSDVERVMSSRLMSWRRCTALPRQRVSARYNVSSSRVGPGSRAILNHSSGWGWSRRNGSIKPCKTTSLLAPRLSKRRRLRASKATNCCTSMCAATTFACSLTESCWSIGTTFASTKLWQWRIPRHSRHTSFELASWLPSLHAEGGPTPWSMLPGAAEFASALSGYFAALAGLPSPEGAPKVRIFNRPIPAAEDRTPLGGTRAWTTGAATLGRGQTASQLAIL